MALRSAQSLARPPPPLRRGPAGGARSGGSGGRVWVLSAGMTDLAGRGYGGSGGARVSRCALRRASRGLRPHSGAGRPAALGVVEAGAGFGCSARVCAKKIRHTRACRGYLAVVRTKPCLRLIPRQRRRCPGPGARRLRGGALLRRREEAARGLGDPSYPRLPRALGMRRSVAGCAGALSCAGGRRPRGAWVSARYPRQARV